jgi:hypothetical protein
MRISLFAAPTGLCKEYGIDNVGTVPAAISAYLGIQVSRR